MNSRAILAVMLALVVGYMAGALFNQPPEATAWRIKAQGAEWKVVLLEQKAALLEQELAEMMAALEQ